MKNHFEQAEKKEARPESLAEQLANIFKDVYPEVVHRNLEELRNRKHELIVIESDLFDEEFLEHLARYDIDPAIISPHEKDGLYKIDVKDHFHDERLPEGYAYKGGAARALLYRALSVDPDARPRDIDIVRLSRTEPYVGADNELAQKFMPDDYEYGDGVEILDLDRDDYFETRDLTLNEILADDNNIIVSQRALSDTVRHILRITEYERDKAQSESWGMLPSKIMAKTLRMYSESIERYGEERFHIDESQRYVYEEYFITPFFLAVHLDRAYEQGESVAETYTQQLKKFGQIPSTIHSAEDLAYYLNRLMNSSPFHYRHAPVDQYRLEEEWEKSIEQV